MMSNVEIYLFLKHVEIVLFGVFTTSQHQGELLCVMLSSSILRLGLTWLALVLHLVLLFNIKTKFCFKFKLPSVHSLFLDNVFLERTYIMINQESRLLV